MADIKEIEAIAIESGNNFHCRVLNEFKSKSWETLVSPYYMDAATEKPREIDLVVEKYWKHTNQYERKFGAIAFRLNIECKYITQSTVFWFARKNESAAEDWLISNTPLRRDNMYTGRHHYLASCPMVAKLFASKNKPSTENEQIYKALNQSLNSLVYMSGYGPISSDLREGKIPILAEVAMPVIVCSSFDEFYSVDMESPGIPEPITDNFQLEVNYAYKDSKGLAKSDYFLIDVVAFPLLENYFETLASDRSAIEQIL